jgi:hypothetical protein
VCGEKEGGGSETVINMLEQIKKIKKTKGGGRESSWGTFGYSKSV